MATLLRFVIDATGLSRRKAFAAIREGRVAVDGGAVLDPSGEYEAGAVTFDGDPITPVTDAKTYLLMNKPAGFITTRSDERQRRTVFDLIPHELSAIGLHPVGRLDSDSDGLLLLTDDGDLTFRLTHPRHEIEKEYWVSLAEPPDLRLLRALRHGVELDGVLRRPLRVVELSRVEPFDVGITIREGRNRQVRRMVEEAGGRVTRLRRVREGPLALGDLPQGATRRLTPDEVAALRGESIEAVDA